LSGIRDRLKEAVDEIVPPVENDIDELKEEIWYDLSAIYYKYDDESQKRAFREVMEKIHCKIKEGKWEHVYQKLHREEQKRKKEA
jgi:hypothetical protein